MRVLFNKNIAGWRMTGILAQGARWFFGLSVLPKQNDKDSDTWILKSEYDTIVSELDDLKHIHSYTANKQYIVCAAVRNTVTGQIICSPRHYDLIYHQSLTDVEKYEHWMDADQGFVNQFGKFLTRAEAWKIVLAAGQLRRHSDVDGQELYSENLY